MPLQRLTRYDIIEAITKSPWTTNFRHLLPVTKRIKRSLERPSWKTFSKKVAETRDRIKYWNIVPGDQIRLLGDTRGTLQEVLAINKLRNRVYVRGLQFQKEEMSEEVRRKNKNYHYSRCQLYLGDYEFPAKEGETKPQTLPVFAKRLGTSAPKWNSFLHRYQWDRFATATTPTIPHLKAERINIPWPKPESRTHAEPTRYDTLKEEVAKVTYEPPPFTPTLKGLIPRTPTEREFLRALYNSPEHHQQQPVEQFLSKELSNPHSRAKKLKRWQSAQIKRKVLLKKMIEDEMKEPNGRSAGEVRAEATFKWRQKLDEEKKALRKARWQRRGGEVKLEKKHARRLRKEEKKRDRLTALVLKDEPNQVIPKDVVV
ncbi:hypothetical protein L218DRAFT_954604 [Marasmius fiardii PR-910]|nr:hypothetical protein L218DRAFT_954604 [Marasmius fiardii PR-910]